MSALLDSNGNINSSQLSKELKEALDFDVKYKQTDNMKKRACRVAGDYDEFKAMVACAHLKKLTRDEVESLSQVKKGWQRCAQKDKSGNANILTEENQAELLQSYNDSIAEKLQLRQIRKPKTIMEFERDYRRIRSHEQQLRYILSTGLKRTKQLFKESRDTDTVELILQALAQVKNFTPEPLAPCEKLVEETAVGKAKNPAMSGACLIVEEDRKAIAESKDTENAEPVFTEVDMIKWLMALRSFDSFEMMIRFCSKELKKSLLDLRDRSQSAALRSVIDSYIKA